SSSADASASLSFWPWRESIGRFRRHAPYNPGPVTRWRRSIRGVGAAFLLFAAVAAALSAQTDDPRLWSALRWRMIGPFRGGRVLTAAGVPGEPERFYFGSVGGGVWRTDNAGRTWRPIFDGQPIASIGSIALAPSNASILYVGSGEADMRSDISYG